MTRLFRLFLAFVFAVTLTQTWAAEKPNIVLIYADDLGYGDLSCYGAELIQTPHIDQLAREGRRFTDYHSASAVCSPSRYALLTGEYPSRINLFNPLFLHDGLALDPSQSTLASMLKKEGYKTACIGKWHLGMGDTAPDWNGALKPGPLEVGFDTFFGMPTVNSHPPFVWVQDHHVVGLDPKDPFVFGKPSISKPYPEKRNIGDLGGADEAHRLYEDERVGTTIAKKAVEYISKTGDQPFFLYLATTNIHHPFTPAPEFQGTSKAGRYGDFVHELDWIVGQVETALDKKGIKENTLLIFTSDNGGMFNDGGQDAWKAGHTLNGELLGFKFGAWEGGHRVPFIVRWPGKVPAQSVSDHLMGSVDLFATLAEVVGYKLKGREAADSFSALKLFTEQNPDPVRDHLLIVPFRETHVSLRKGDWMYIPDQSSGGFGGNRGGPEAIRRSGRPNSDITADGQIKPDAPKAQLYNLKSDLPETTNVYREHPGEVRKLDFELRLRMAARGTRSGLTSVEVDGAFASKPNFIIIFCDDMGYADIGPFGAQGYQTPNLDRMAAEGMIFTDFHVGFAVCSPSRSALITGSYPKRISVNGNFGPESKTGLNPNEFTIAEVLKQENYATACFGKWHLGHQPEFLPTSQGFDEFYGLPYSHDMWERHPENGTRYNFPVLPLYEGKSVIKSQLTPEDQKKHTRNLTHRTVEFIEKNKSHPFFIYLPHPLPHVPLYTAPEFEGKTRRGLYGDVVEELDWSVGQILAALDKNGLRDNTLVVFTSDNGPWLRYGDHGGSAGPLREGKGTFFEGGFRVPGIMSWPGKIKKGAVNNHFAATIDLLPTFASLAGAPLPKDRIIDGHDIRPLLFGWETTDYNRTFYHFSGANLSAVRNGKWKLVLAESSYVVWEQGNGGLPGQGSTRHEMPLSLYDLEADVGETNNVADKYPAIVAKLQNLASRARADLGDGKLPGNNVRPLGGRDN